MFFSPMVKSKEKSFVVEKISFPTEGVFVLELRAVGDDRIPIVDFLRWFIII